jgi:hypothetical protein
VSANRFATFVRTAWAQQLIALAGPGAKLKAYSGAVPAGVSAVDPDANPLRATATFGSAFGTADGSGNVDWNESGAAQVPGSFANGTPTFVDLTTASDVVVARHVLNVVDGLPWTGAIVTGQPFGLNDIVTVMPGAT